MDGRLIPGEALIYERDDHGVVYARYRDPPHNTIPRWIIGGPAESDRHLGISDLVKIREIANTNAMFKRELDKFLNLYYLLRDTTKR